MALRAADERREGDERRDREHDEDDGGCNGAEPERHGGGRRSEAGNRESDDRLVAPIALVLWFMSMDAVPALLHAQSWDVNIMRRVSIAFGLGMMFVAFLVDHRADEDFAFWLYLFGMTAFWGAVTSIESDSELSKLVYCAMNLGFVVLSVPLRRRVFLVFGSLGVNLYLGHLAWRVFEHSMLFPFALTLLGLAIITVAVWYQRHRAAIELRVESWVPLWIRDLLPPARAAR